MQVLDARKIENKGVDLADFDITDAQATHDYIAAYRPDAVIHCSAWTAVDKAEDEMDKVRGVNTEGPRNIAKVCKEIGAKMLYISTDSVFPGTGEGSMSRTIRPARSALTVRLSLAANWLSRSSWITILSSVSRGYLARTATILSRPCCALRRHTTRLM